MENNKMTTAQRMRQVAGWLYVAATVFQILVLYGSMSNYPLTSIPVALLFDLLIILLTGGLSIYLIGGTTTLKSNLRRGIYVGTIFVVIFALITFTVQTSIYNMALSTLLGVESVSLVWQVVFMLIRIVLIILAAFFVSSSNEDIQKREMVERMEAIIEAEEDTGDAAEASFVVEEIREESAAKEVE